MKNLSLKKWLPLSMLAVTALLPLEAQAHRQWLLPSATVLAGNDPWMTVDAAVSNDLFDFENFPLKLDGLQITAPDGSAVQAEGASTGHLRSVFDLQLKQQGTYKIAVTTTAVMASYKLNGENKRWRGDVQALAKEIPADATDLKVTQMDARIETFVTRGKPTTSVFKPTGKGLELAPITHPDDLVAGTPASFRLLFDGKAAANLKVTIIPGGKRFRDQVGDFVVNTDADGKFSVKWPNAGLYYIGAETTDNASATKPATERRANYGATVEVAPQ